MSHEFTSGVFVQEGAWHGLGEVSQDQLSAEEAFTKAGALFPVAELETWAGNPSRPDEMIPLRQHAKTIWRPDTRKVFGTVSPGWEIIPNQRLLDFAKAIEKEANISAVVVLREGAKVAFTGELTGLTGTVVPGDQVKRYIVGYLGHQSGLGYGGMFTNVRVVCANTLGYALGCDGKSGFSIAHNSFEIEQLDRIIEQIDFARQSFPEVITQCQAMQAVPMGIDGLRDYLNRVYSQVLPPVRTQDGDIRPGLISDVPAKAERLVQAFQYGKGQDIPGVANTLWAAFNAITEVEASIPTPANNRRRFHSVAFGSARRIITIAEREAKLLAGIA